MSLPLSAQPVGTDRRGSTPAARRHRFLPAALSLPVIAVLSVSGAGVAAADAPDFALTVGIPNAANGSGEVDNRLGADCCGRLISERRSGLELPGRSSARFGSAILSSYDLNGDFADDLIVGAPGTPGQDETDQPGRVHVFFGSAEGVLTAGSVLANHADPGDEFGAALSLGAMDTSEARYGVRDLWIGAPGHDVAGKVDAGAVFRYEISATGAVGYLETITQDSPLVPGSAEAGDRFGEVMGRGGMVGVPGEDVGTARDAGTVLILRTNPDTRALVMATEWNQNTAGVPGVAETGDRFGAALTGNAVGVPGEDIGTIKDAGVVQVLGGDAISQNSRWIPGKAEAGDRFGTALSSGYRIQDYSTGACSEMDSLAIGAPGEDVGRVKDAGSILLTQARLRSANLEPGFTYCPPETLGQGHGLPGKAEAGDQVGATLGLRSGDPYDEESQLDTLLIGVPGEDVGTTKDAGRVVLRTRDVAKSVGPSGGDIGGRRFGTVLTQGTPY